MAAIDLSNDDVAQATGYACRTCGKAFVTVQALGGHQNAHRTERFALKRRQIEMKRQLARQASLLPRPAAVAGPSSANWPPAPAPCGGHPANVINSMVPPPVPAEDDDVEEGLDLTLRL